MAVEPGSPEWKILAKESFEISKKKKAGIATPTDIARQEQILIEAGLKEKPKPKRIKEDIQSDIEDIQEEIEEHNQEIEEHKIALEDARGDSEAQAEIREEIADTRAALADARVTLIELRKELKEQAKKEIISYSNIPIKNFKDSSVKSLTNEFSNTYWKWILPIGAILFGLLILESQTGYIKEKLILPLKYRVLNTWLPTIKSYAAKYSIDPAFIAAIIYQESRGNPLAISSVGATGLMQIMPKTGLSVCGLSLELLKNPVYNIDCGVKYLAENYKKYGSYEWTASAYYGGPGTPPTSTKGSPPVKEYVASVMEHFKNIKSVIT